MNAKRTTAALATALAAVGVAIGSGATFTAQSANPANTFSSGTLQMSNSKNADGKANAILTGSNMKPGDSKTGEVTITNTGSIAGTFKLSEKDVSNAFGADSLHLVIQDISNATPVSVYNGDLGELPAAGISLGSFAAGEAHTYRYTVTLDASAPNTDQGKSASATYQWDATQS